MAKTSGIASTVAVRARAKLASLQRKRGVGDYDSTELDHAIIMQKSANRTKTDKKPKRGRAGRFQRLSG